MPQTWEADSGPRWDMIEAESHLPSAQELIRREIEKGTIRVLPREDGGIRIVPQGGRVPHRRERTEPTASSVGAPPPTTPRHAI